MQSHESWCYRTLAAVDCYTQPQDESPERLVGVDPLKRQPITPEGHTQARLQAEEDVKRRAAHQAEILAEIEAELRAKTEPKAGVEMGPKAEVKSENKPQSLLPFEDVFSNPAPHLQ